MKMKKLYMLGASLFISLAMISQTAVTFQVNLGEAMADAAGVHIAGSFHLNDNPYPEWDPAGIALSDDDMDNIWSVELMLAPGDYEYKFINGNSWGMDEGIPSLCATAEGNRGVTVGEMDMTLDPVCFTECNNCGVRTVVFRVDMSQEEAVNPVGVHVAGDFQGWDPTTFMLTDDDSDLIYEYVHTYTPESPDAMDTLNFKFINDNSFNGFEENVSGDCAAPDASGNRQEVITEAYTELPAYCYNTCGTCVAPTTVTFRVNMSLETVEPAGVYIAGSFQGWTENQDALTDLGGDIWEWTTELAPGDYQYKYINGGLWSGPNESIPEECNVGGNRGITVPEQDETLVVEVCYNQCSADCVADPDAADITFSVNMNDVETISPDGVFLIGGFTDPVWQGGATQMTDDNNDGIYVATLNVDGPANIQYKFVNGDVNVPENEENAGIEECGIDNGIGGFNRTHARSGSAETLDIACFDSCAECEVSVEEILLDRSLSIYPNPAQSELTIEFESNDDLIISIINALGQTILTQNASDNVRLDISELNSGIYTVTLASAEIAVNRTVIIE